MSKRSRGGSKRKRDDHGVEWARAALEALGCPNVRRGEGSAEWERTKGAYRFTPDLVAGPLVGGGDPSDFYIDVFEPTGDQYVKPLAGNPKAAVTFLRSLVEGRSFDFKDLDDNFAQFTKPMNDKLAKYVGSRSNTPMFGLAMYFRMTGNQYVGPVFAAIQSLNALDGAFGITNYLGAETKEKLIVALLSPGQTAFILRLPIKQPLSLVLSVVEKSDGPRVVMLVNHTVTDPAHPYAAHPVIHWLRDKKKPASL